jgi:hypothetical protein
LQRPHVGPHFHQGNLRPAAAGRLDCLANVARVMNHRMHVVERADGRFQFFAETLVGTDD